MRWRSLALASVAGGCAGVEDSAGRPATTDFSERGPWTPARQTLIVDDEARGRRLTIETWYPGQGDRAEASILDLIPGEPERGTYEALLASAPPGCPSLTTTAAVGSSPEPGPWPVVAMSHCHECTRFSTLSVAEHLASHGFVVVAPDHAGNTLFDAIAGDPLPLDTETLALRVADLQFALGQTLAGELVAGLDLDPTQVGVFGHSFGAVTAGLVLQELLGESGGPVAAMFVGAPPENPFLAGVSVQELDAPLMFEALAEDHSVGSAGNLLIANNFAAAPNVAWHFVVADAGHWSPSDLVGITEDFMPGCGDDERQETGEPFTYLSPSQGREVTASLAAAFFGAYVAGDSDGEAWLAAAMTDDRVVAERR